MKTRTLVHTLALTCALLTLPAFAETDGTWTQTAAGTYDWSDPANWAGGTVANGTDATATFDVTPGGDQTINLDTAVTLGGLSITWGNRSLNIEGSETLTFAATAGIPSVSTTRPLTISSQISGTDGLQKDGGGVLLLNGTNDYTGGTVVNAGRLNIASDAALGAASGSITLNGGDLAGKINATTTRTGSVSISTARDVIIEAGGGGIAAHGNGSITTSGKLSGTGILTFIDVGGAGGRSLNFNSTDNDFTGGFVSGANSQTIQVNSLLDSANNIAFTRNVAGSATFRYGSGAITALTLTKRAFELNGSGAFSVTIESANTSNAITVNTDLVATGAGAKTLTLSGSAGPTNVFAGNIADETDGGSGTVALTKSGASTWVLSGANTYTGITTVSGGTLALRGDESLPHEGTLNIAGGKVDIEGKASVAELQYAGGELLPHGIYGSTDSGAENQNDDRFSGTGVLYVGVPFPPSGTMILLR